ncbi:hypothetical protein ENKO_147 [Klebsiella phage fENko-Kae01]|nr:hypothetical protein [Klebsiella phage fENko-Kae01]
MSKQVIVFGCPLCGSKAFWTKGNAETRMNDRVQCLTCFLEMEGDYEPMSAVLSWNMRVHDNYIQDSVYSIDGERIE